MRQVATNNVRKSFDIKVYTLIVFVALSDFIFFKHAIGTAAGIYFLLFLAFLAYYNKLALDDVTGKIFLWSACGQALIFSYYPNPLSLALYTVFVILLSFLGKGVKISNALKPVALIGQFLFSALFKIFEEYGKYLKVRTRIRKTSRLSGILSRWTLAIVLSIVFIFLFSLANPLIGNWLKQFDLRVLVPDISVFRIVFWWLSAMIFTSFLKPPGSSPLEEAIDVVERKQSWLFHKKSILNALAAFNVIFFVQTLSDLFYLWGGAGLPEGMSYAAYAQQGAYPLMVTAILAAIFVLTALNTDEHSSTDKWVKRLIYVWVAQNIFLVISAILRTNLYIEQYSLTYLRFAALIWMGLVAIGLASIIVRIALSKTNTWLVNANAIGLMSVLYICSALNIGGIIAGYNIRHSQEVSGEGPPMDVAYLREIGPASLPAIRWLKEQPNNQAYELVRDLEGQIESHIDDRLGHWRSWTYRDYLLSGK